MEWRWPLGLTPFPFSRRAYLPQITPKMCLLEWCRREKLAQPVYETVSSWLCGLLCIPPHSLPTTGAITPSAPTARTLDSRPLGWSLALPSFGVQQLLVAGLVADSAFPLTVGLLSNCGYFHKTELVT